jgi:hypothetical protein
MAGVPSGPLANSNHRERSARQLTQSQTWKQMNNLLMSRCSFVRDVTIHRRVINPMKLGDASGEEVKLG